MKFKFVSPVDTALFEATKIAWQKQLEDNLGNISAPYYEAGLAYCELVAAGKSAFADGSGCLCAVVEDDNQSASALLVVSHAKPKSDNAFLKMLDVFVQPNLNLADTEPKYPELAWIAAVAIIGCLGLTYADYPSRQLKMHTAFPLDNAFMIGLTTAIFRDDSNWAENYELSAHGSWVVLTKKAGTNGAHVPVGPFKAIS
jgi:hypothetical protein